MCQSKRRSHDMVLLSYNIWTVRNQTVLRHQRYIEQVLQKWWKEPGSRIALVFELRSKFTFKDVEKD